jgi:hypothetical protein
MKIDRKHLRELAENATPGPWKRSSSCHQVNMIFSETEGYVISDFVGTIAKVRPRYVQQKANGEYIAAFNPETAKALLDALDEAERAIANIVRDPKDNLCTKCRTDTYEYIVTGESIDDLDLVLKKLRGEG